jgi:Ankyrin repeats (3 copies)
MLQRPDEAPCQLPMSYQSSSYPGEGWQIGSDCVTEFRREPQPADQEGFHLPSSRYDYENMYGDKKMHDWLKKNKLLNEHSTWQPLQDKDRSLASSPLHTAALSGNLQQVRACLQREDNIDESDSTERTALHISIQTLQFQLFHLLLARGANFELQTGNGLTPLHEAAIVDTKGPFLLTLINAGADINAKIKGHPYENTPLGCAIQAKNLKAVELLIKAGAKISYKNHEALEDPAFSPLHKLGLIPPRICTSSDLDYWINRGDCVVLHDHGSHGIMCHQPKTSNRRPTLIYVDVHPQSHLLNEGAQPSFLKSYHYTPYEAEKIKKGRFAKTSNFKLN